MLAKCLVCTKHLRAEPSGTWAHDVVALRFHYGHGQLRALKKMSDSDTGKSLRATPTAGRAVLPEGDQRPLQNILEFFGPPSISRPFPGLCSRCSSPGTPPTWKGGNDPVSKMQSSFTLESSLLTNAPGESA